MRLSAFSRKSCNTRYTQQAQLVEEASEALRAAEAESSLRHQEFVALQQQWEADIQHAVDKAMSQYQLQLSSVKRQPAAEGPGVSTLHPEAAGSGAIIRAFAGRSGYFTFCGYISH